jgi:hypothetical protein
MELIRWVSMMADFIDGFKCGYSHSRSFQEFKSCILQSSSEALATLDPIQLSNGDSISVSDLLSQWPHIMCDSLFPSDANLHRLSDACTDDSSVADLLKHRILMQVCYSYLAILHQQMLSQGDAPLASLSIDDIMAQGHHLPQSQIQWSQTDLKHKAYAGLLVKDLLDASSQKRSKVLQTLSSFSEKSMDCMEVVLWVVAECEDQDTRDLVLNKMVIPSIALEQKKSVIFKTHPHLLAQVSSVSLEIAVEYISFLLMELKTAENISAQEEV